MTSVGNSKDELLAALAAATDRLADLLRSLSAADGRRPVPGLGWSLSETAAHVVTVVGRLLGDRRRSTAPGETDQLNEICLKEFIERDTQVLADRLEADMRTVIDRVYPKVDFDREYPFHAGTTISGGGGAEYLLCELLVHGYDVAAASGRDWPIPAVEARIAVRGPAEFWMRLLAGDGFPTLKVVVDEIRRLEFPIIRTTTIDDVSTPVQADPVELLLAEFGRKQVSDDRLAAVLGALPQI